MRYAKQYGTFFCNTRTFYVDIITSTTVQFNTLSKHYILLFVPKKIKSNSLYASLKENVYVT